MALDPTSQIANVQRSFKKYMVDNINRVEKIRVSFDMDLTPPEKQGVKFNKWLAVNYKTTTPKNVSMQMVQLACCTRKDAEGETLADFRDTVMGYLTDTTNNTRRITLYDSSWSKLGAMMVYIDNESGGPQRAEDGTKFWLISITLKWGAKI